MKTNKKRNIAIVLTGVLCIILFSCARERGRTDIALEMTDEDSVEAIIDQDLLTAGGTVVNLEEPEKTTSVSAVTYVDETDSQESAVVQPDESLKPEESATTSSDIEPAIGLIDVEDTQIADADKKQEEVSAQKRKVERTMTTEELIAENKALINSEILSDKITKTNSDENIIPGDAVAEEETTTTENVLPGEAVETATSNASIKETAADEITSPDKSESNVVEAIESEEIVKEKMPEATRKFVKPKKNEVMPAVVRPPGGGYYTEYRTLAKTPSAPAAVSNPSYSTHTVKRGDTLWVISRKYGCTISELVAENNISRRAILKIGQILKIPVKQSKKETNEPAAEKTAVTSVVNKDELPVTPEELVSETVEVEVEAPKSETEIYTVQSGDSYWKIAKKFGVTSTELMSLNNTSSSLIRVGQKILVPRR
ncbi:MAG: hypothetical protein DRI44_03390 [Chlamydiae bacterium]|nr:MAG: hypothetical protein DRI44_03390 [Chlamydiota bacterium]